EAGPKHDVFRPSAPPVNSMEVLFPGSYSLGLMTQFPPQPALLTPVEHHGNGCTCRKCSGPRPRSGRPKPGHCGRSKKRGIAEYCVGRPTTARKPPGHRDRREGAAQNFEHFGGLSWQTGRAPLFVCFGFFAWYKRKAST